MKSKLGIQLMVFVMMLSVFSLFVVAQEMGTGNYRISGIVKNENGSPLENAKVVAVLMEKPVFYSQVGTRFYRHYPTEIKRTFYTDSEGKWSLLGAEAGAWRIRAFSNNKISEPLDLIIDEFNQSSKPELSVNKPAVSILLEAKEMIRQGDWVAAVLLSKWFIHHFPNSSEVSTAKAWLAFFEGKLHASVNNTQSYQ
jgi:hypothetical protein